MTVSRPRGSAAALGGVVFVLAASVPRAARADDCGRPDLRDTVPPDMATDVPPNASLFAHYAPSAEYINEDVIRFLTIRVDEHEAGPSAMMRRGDKERSPRGDRGDRDDRPSFRAREEEVE